MAGQICRYISPDPFPVCECDYGMTHDGTTCVPGAYSRIVFKTIWEIFKFFRAARNVDFAICINARIHKCLAVHKNSSVSQNCVKKKDARGIIALLPSVIYSPSECSCVHYCAVNYHWVDYDCCSLSIQVLSASRW